MAADRGSDLTSTMVESSGVQIPVSWVMRLKTGDTGRAVPGAKSGGYPLQPIPVSQLRSI